MDMAMNVPIYWAANQVMLTIFSDLLPGSADVEYIKSANDNLQELNTQALKGTHFTLARLDPSSSGAKKMADTDDMGGIYVYTAPPGPIGSSKAPTANIAVLCSVESAMKAKEGKSEHASMGHENADSTLEAIKHLNTYGQSHQAKTRTHTMPNWFWTGVPDETHGCPITPPFPAEKSGDKGQWKTLMPRLPAALQASTGAGVTVFILDAFPSAAQIASAASLAGASNTLLQRMATGLTGESSSQAQPPAISLNATYSVAGPQETAVTGKDIYGRLSGFPMADHGLFIAGLVRDLAPEARIECVRVLNDFGVGECRVLLQALIEIEGRLREGDLQYKPVVVNLSLVVGPPECDLARLKLTTQTEKESGTQSLPDLLGDLLAVMKSMASRGAVFVAAAGNDSDPRDFDMNPSEVRFNARYPAAFAMSNPDFSLLKEVFPVGAVNQQGTPSAYSNYPGPDGIATYGGELPKPSPWFPSAASHVLAQVDTSSPIDALCGLYSGSAYPALSRNDRYPVAMQPEPAKPSPSDSMEPEVSSYPLYRNTWTNAWAYWAGTSFAAPIISALVARILQGQSMNWAGDYVRTALVAASQQIQWTGLEDGSEASGSMIAATQQWVTDDPHYS